MTEPPHPRELAIKLIGEEVVRLLSMHRLCIE